MKSIESAISKSTRKNYSDPNLEITDLVGIRIVTYLESDIDQVERELRNIFTIDEENSVDKRKSSNVNLVGYRSLHLICTLGETRELLPEYKDICNTKFEVQVRTALEHTWAEIEHKQNYKASSNSSLPKELQRRLMILAGTLELLDRELASIANDAMKYHSRIKENFHQIEDDAISSLSLRKVTEEILSSHGLKIFSVTESDFSGLIRELANFGVKTNLDLKVLIESYFNKFDRIENEPGVHGFIRDTMLVEDRNSYFRNSYNGQYHFLIDDVEWLATLWGIPTEDAEAELEELGAQIEYIRREY